MNKQKSSLSLYLIAGTISVFSMAPAYAKPDLTAPVLVNMYQTGIVAKEIINTITSQLEEANLASLETTYLSPLKEKEQKAIDALIEKINVTHVPSSQLTEVQKKELDEGYKKIKQHIEQERKNITKTIIDREQDAFKAKSKTAAKFLEESLKTLILILGQRHYGLPKSEASSVANAFNAGLKLGLMQLALTTTWPYLTDIPQDLVKRIKNDIKDIIKLMQMPAAYAYEFEPIKIIPDTTALYCGPKDPYCLHGRPQQGLDETLAAISSTLVPEWMKPVISTLIGIWAVDYGFEVGQLLTTKFINVAHILLQGIDGAPFTLSGSPYLQGMTDVIKKTVEYFVQTKLFDEIKWTFMDLTQQIGAEFDAQGNIKKGGTIRKAQVAAWPSYKKLADDLKHLLHD